MHGAIAPACSLEASDAREAAQPRDRIEVIGHIAVTGQINRLLPTQHYSRYYLYAERANGKATVIDITDAAAPSLVADVSYPANGRSDDLLAVSGTAALTASPRRTREAAAPQTVQIMNFADPAHPEVAREFNAVTAIGSDNQRKLVFLADPDGVWILREHFAQDPAMLRSHADRTLYDH